MIMCYELKFTFSFQFLLPFAMTHDNSHDAGMTLREWSQA